MMYANVTSDDSAASFGIGTYSMDPNSVTEHIFYTGNDTVVNSEKRDYTLKVSEIEKGYKQVIPEIGTTPEGKPYILTEDYRAEGSTATSPLDGAWELVKTYTIKGKDTIPSNFTAYKIYYESHFIWGHTYQDPSKINHTGIGFGTFELEGNKLMETVNTSSYPEMVGKTMRLMLILMKTKPNFSNPQNMHPAK